MRSCGGCRSPTTAAAPRSLEVTSYAEVVLAPADADLAHPAFSNLFVETCACRDRDALICARAPARPAASRPYLVHVLSGRGAAGRRTQYETDRARFVGRGRTVEQSARAAAGTDAAVEYHRRRCSIRSSACARPCACRRAAPPGSPFTTGYADSEDAARQLIEKYHDRRAVARALALASTHSQIELRHLGLDRRGHLALPAAGGPAALRRSAAARRARRSQANARGQSRAVEIRHLRRPADPADPDLRGTEFAAVSRTAEGARISAAQGACLRSRRAERARVELPPGSAGLAAADRRKQSRAGLDRSGRAACSCAAPT